MADVNELIGGYKLRTMLQTGQTSQVFEVVEPNSNRHFAMKLLLPEAAAQARASKGVLFNEAEVGVKMTHQNVIRILQGEPQPADAPALHHGVLPVGQPAAPAPGQGREVSPRTRPEDLQGDGDRPGVHELQRLRPPRREAGQYPRERLGRNEDHRLRHLEEDSDGVLRQVGSTGRSGKLRARRAS